MNTEGTERRNQIRYDFLNTVEYIPRNESYPYMLKGVTINKSNTGLCIYTFNLLKEDDEILIEKSMLPINQKQAKVRWIRKIGVNLYKAGLIFK